MAGPGDRWVDVCRSTELLVTGRDVNRVQPLIENRAAGFGLADQIQSAGGGINHRRTGHANLRKDVLETIANIRPQDRGLSRSSAMRCIQQVYVPKLLAGAGIGIETV